eukprot:TRINITY_DN6727_c0_g1_i1.p1 TRINITY_DN6727_c0_g1~~TRINITY_DN6727_c0_g1_i1.p1  ORF type:complete len:365 (+),score=73.29 TRINITY_DN6727_c0_g1_i1:189-1283(+)
MQDEEKLENAKTSIIQIVERLDEKDIFHLVCYSTTTNILLQDCTVSPSNIEEIKKKIRDISADGCTNLWAGVEEGARLLTDNRKSVNQITRLFLFSDGCVNRGEQDHGTILQNVHGLYQGQSIQVSAFGLGTDFDEDLMKGISEKGNGIYFFISNSQSIPNFVEFAFASIRNSVGYDSVLKLRGLNSCHVTKFYGHHCDLQVGASLGDLLANNVRYVMARLEVRKLDFMATEQEVVSCCLTYCREETCYTCKKTLSLKFTTDESKVTENTRPEVVVRMAFLKIVKLNRKISTCNDEKKAMELQKEVVGLLAGVLKLDNECLGGENKVELLLVQAKKTLENLEKKGLTKSTVKKAHHKSYRMSRG